MMRMLGILLPVLCVTSCTEPEIRTPVTAEELAKLSGMQTFVTNVSLNDVHFGRPVMSRPRRGECGVCDHDCRCDRTARLFLDRPSRAEH